MDKEPIDCRYINGDQPVIISQNTAREGRNAIRHLAKIGAYKELPADDASFIRAALKELTKAAETP